MLGSSWSLAIAAFDVEHTQFSQPMRMRRRLQSGADLLVEAGGGLARQPRNHPVLITAYNLACVVVPLCQKIQRDAEDCLCFEHLVDGAVSFSFLD